MKSLFAILLLCLPDAAAYGDPPAYPAPIAPVEVFPLLSNTVFQRHVVGEAAAAPAGGERLIYSNTLGTFAAALGAGRLVSDDIATIAAPACKLRRFEFPVVGKINPNGLGGPYTVDIAVYTTCPQSVPTSLRPALIVPGLVWQAVFPDDAPRLISIVAPDNVSLNTNFWFGVKFSRNNAGPIMGAPALVGFSADNWDFPGFPCQSSLGGFPNQPHASFNLEIYGDADCPAAFVGYKNEKPSGSLYNAGPSVTFADDIQLGVNECQMIAYEVAVRGVGFYTFDMRQNCDQTIIPGTQRVFSVFTGNTEVNIARFNFDPPVPLPQDLWFAAKINNSTGKIVITGKQADMGGTENLFGLPGPSGCTFTTAGPWIHSAFSLTITCAGSPPVGACCDMVLTQCSGGPNAGAICWGRCLQDATWHCISNRDCPDFGICAINVDCNTCQGGALDGLPCDPMIPPGQNPCIQNGGACPLQGTCESICRQVPEMNCPWPPRFLGAQPGWVEGATCSPDPFSLPCGVAACCRPDQVCENLTLNECNAVPPLDRPRQWQKGRHCDLNYQQCPWVACLSREGDCMSAREEAGCENPDCCVDVCDTDSYCCFVEWDRSCVELAEQLCVSRPTNDLCHAPNELGTTLVEADSATFFANTYAAESKTDPGFCCHADAADAQGFGSVWFKFTATDTSARVSTCASDPALDSLVNVFSVGDPTTVETACATLSMIACSDDVDECGGGSHGDICVHDLVPGQTYYVTVASKTAEQRGLHQLDIRSPCFNQPIWNPNDCNENQLQDGCELGSRSSFDCNDNRILDDCDITDETSADCNGNTAPDECDIAIGTSLDCQPNGIPDECDLNPGNRLYCDCDDDGVADDSDEARQRLVSDPPIPSLGYRLATSGDRLLVSGDYVIRDDDDWLAAFDVFVLQDSTWVWEAKLVLPEEVGQYNAYASPIALDGDRAFIGVPRYDQPSNVSAVYIFVRSQDGWEFERKLVNPAPTTHRNFGQSLDANQDRLAVSTYRMTANYGSIGEVLVYHRAGSDWVLDTSLHSPNPADLSGNFGVQVDLDPDALAVGAHGYYAGNGVWRAGAVFIFRLRGAQWNYEAEIQSPVGPGSPDFGYPLAFRDNVLVVMGQAGVRPPNLLPSSGFVFVCQSGKWTFESELLDPNVQSGGRADSVAVINGGVVMMGSTDGVDLTTRGLVFARSQYGDWNPSGILRTPEHAYGKYASSSIVGHDRSIIVGNPIGSGQTAGSAETGSGVYVFSLPRIDCQTNGLWDACEIRDDPSLDCDGDAAPDQCQAILPFDHNFDGHVDLADLAGFQRCFTGPGPTTVAPCCRMFDAEPDADVDLIDYAALSPALTGP